MAVDSGASCVRGEPPPLQTGGERTLAWLVRCRQLTIDYEVLPTTSEAFIHAPMVRLMVRRLA